MRKGGKLDDPIVVTFPFLVEIVSKTHSHLDHIGREKLFGMISPFFWHPALYKTCQDLCRSCKWCQLFKTSKAQRTLLVKKINVGSSFELLCLDLHQLPRTQKGNVALLVCIDHFSKWVNAVPIKDKKSSTVARVLSEEVLSKIPKLPDRILSDNGPEFVGEAFERMLQRFNIVHSFSTPYHAAGNGACERMNRTLIQRLKAYSENKWDEDVYDATINYNNTIHSELKMSPSECIMKQAHGASPRFPINGEIADTWREGHPNFSSFKLGDKVAKKIIYIGNQLKNKLSPRFDGPYVIKKVFQNGVSYAIMKEQEEKLIKVNHKYLKKWYEMPKYLEKFLPKMESQCNSKLENTIVGPIYSDSSNSVESSSAFASSSSVKSTNSDVFTTKFCA